MIQYKKILMTLALLITAVGGAWAQDDYDIDVDFASSYSRMGTHFMCRIMSMEPREIKGTLNLSVDGESKGSFNVDGEEVFDFITPGLDAGNHTYSAVFSPEGGGSVNKKGDFTINQLYTSIAYYGSTSINMGVGESTELDVYVAPDGADGLSYSSSDASVASITKKEYSNDTYIIQAKATGTATITFSFAGNKNYKAAEEDKTITVTVLPAPIKVTTNAAEEGGTFTEASFEMPTSDVDVNYELVRDMSVQMTATMGDGTDGVRYRVKKAQQGEGYEPADLNMMQVLALVAVNDGIEQKTLTLDEDYFCRIYKLDEQTLQPEGDGVKLIDFDFAPGLYALKAFAQIDSDYDGETALSNTFKLFEGSEPEPQPAASDTITWNHYFCMNVEAYYDEDEECVIEANNTKDGITLTFVGSEIDDGLTGDYIELYDESSILTFTSTVGNIQKIEIYYTENNNAIPDGWTLDATNNKFVWEGTPAAAVNMVKGDGDVDFGIDHIVFIVESQGGTTAVENVQTNHVQATKFFRDGQLLIKKNGKIYNVQGVEAK